MDLPGVDRHTGPHPRAGLEHPTGFAKGTGKVGHELETVAAGRRIEAGVGKAQLFDVHQVESQREVCGSAALGQFDHAGRQIDADHLAVRHHRSCQSIAERARPARQVKDSLAWHQLEPFDHGGSAARLAAGHHLIEALLVGGRVAAEGARVQLLGGRLFQMKKGGSDLPPFTG